MLYYIQDKKRKRRKANPNHNITEREVTQMTSAIETRRTRSFNCYTAVPKDVEAIMTRAQWNYNAQKDDERRCGPVSYWVTGYVNGIFTSLELHNYRAAKHLFLAMCKA